MQDQTVPPYSGIGKANPSGNLQVSDSQNSIGGDPGAPYVPGRISQCAIIVVYEVPEVLGSILFEYKWCNVTPTTAQ